MSTAFTFEEVAAALPSTWRCTSDGPDWRAARIADDAEVTAVRGIDLVSKALTWDARHPAAPIAPPPAPLCYVCGEHPRTTRPDAVDAGLCDDCDRCYAAALCAEIASERAPETDPTPPSSAPEAPPTAPTSELPRPCGVCGTATTARYSDETPWCSGCSDPYEAVPADRAGVPIYSFDAPAYPEAAAIYFQGRPPSEDADPFTPWTLAPSLAPAAYMAPEHTAPTVAELAPAGLVFGVDDEVTDLATGEDVTPPGVPIVCVPDSDLVDVIAYGRGARARRAA